MTAMTVACMREQGVTGVDLWCVATCGYHRRLDCAHLLGETLVTRTAAGYRCPRCDRPLMAMPDWRERRLFDR